MNTKPTITEVKEELQNIIQRHFGCTPKEASSEQMYKACAIMVKSILADKRSQYKKKVNKTGSKRIYYMCMEFLLGRSLKTNLNNLGISSTVDSALKKLGFKLDKLYECEPDAGLGNGGLGRLAACFMDSLSSLDYPATGFSLCYEYGLFKQKIVDGMQVELPDVWLPGGEVWLNPRTDRVFKVRFGGHVHEEWTQDGHCTIQYDDYNEVEAVPYDMLISGADCDAVSQLRLWKARNIQKFNMHLFTQGQYTQALEENTNAEIISKVLYPSDNHEEGKLLRLSQQYFLVSASIQSILRDHMAVYNNIENLPEKIAIHINDTHPALVIPELMRILMDDYFFSWEKAWSFVTQIVSYTNHTVMPEALEKWNEDLFSFKLPRIYMIIKEINRRFCDEAWQKFPGNWDAISRMAIIGYGQVRMANLSVIGSHSVNGVSKLHSEILKANTFKDFYKMTPEKFDNVTNGIAHRRWLCYSNPNLATLLDETIGKDYRHHPEALANFAKFANDAEVLQKVRAIKHQNKIAFSNLIYKKTGQKIDTHSVYDVQIKRLHEYKRQLLNVLNIIGLYLDIKDNPNIKMQPQTFIFGAKAAPGYAMAKRIIQLLCLLSKDIEHNPIIREKINVVFIENYCVSLAEALVPSAEISEQISLAGKEASGTGCMKLMMNGALTIGTLDGANVEMQQAVGKENMFIFGLKANEVDDLWLEGYNAASYYAASPRLKRIVDYLNKGFAGESFADVATYLLNNVNGIADPYMCLADFESYYQTRQKMIELYQNKPVWNKMSLLNIAASGYFTADRCIEEYSSKFWNLQKVKL